MRKFETTGFLPEVVVVDQLQFVEPTKARKGMQTWELQAQAAMELDELSHKTINGQKFALWVNHQAKGKLKRYFSRDEIDGFKGIIHKTDLTIGIGRDNIHANECDIFTLKVRHCPDFHITLEADFKYMRFANRIGTRDREGIALPDYSPATSNPIPNSGSFELPPLPPTLPQ